MSRLQRGLSGITTNSTNPGGANHSRLGTTQPNGDRQANKSFEELKRLIHGKLVDKLDLSRVSDLEGDTLRREIRLVVERLCDTENPLLNRMERERLIDEVLDETFGFGPLEVLLKDPTISDILVNGPHKIYVERRGKLEKTDVKFRDNDHLLQIIDRIVSKVGRRARQRDHSAAGAGRAEHEHSPLRRQPAEAGGPA
jgi:pilus assembly protein CpaF